MDVSRTDREDLVRQIFSQFFGAGHDAQVKFIEHLVSLLGIFLVGLQVLIFESLLLLSRLVFVTKYRREVFTKEILADLRNTFDSVCQDFESELVEFDGENDHVHLLVTYPPKVLVAKLVNSLKGVSSRMIRRMGHESIQKQLWKGALWSPSYFAASCGGAPLSIIKQYIEQQNMPQ